MMVTLVTANVITQLGTFIIGKVMTSHSFPNNNNIYILLLSLRLIEYIYTSEKQDSLNTIPSRGMSFILIKEF